MIGLIEIIVFFAVMMAMLYFRLAAKFWSLIGFLVLLLYSFYSTLNGIFLLPAWAIFLAVAAITQIKPLRLRWLTQPIFQYLHKNMPSISETERIAIETGTVWWEGELFRGNPNWQYLFDLPKAALSDEEQSFLTHQVSQLCAMLDVWKIDFYDYDLPKQVWDYIKQERFFGLVLDKKYGGHHFSAQAHSAIIAKITSRSAVAGVTIMVPNSLGPAELIDHYGTKEQKDYYLPRLAKGEEIPCFALTSLEVGSDAAGMVDSGVICKDKYDGKEVIGIKLNFNKRYITLAPIATLMGLAVKCYDPDHLVGNEEYLGITLCLVPTHLPGMEIGKRHLPIHTPFMNGPVRGKDVFVPLDNIIGGREKCGKGWQMLMEALAVGRGISLPAMSTALTQTVFLTSGAYAALRQQFRLPIGKFEGVQVKLATITGFNYLCEAARTLSAKGIDLGQRPAVANAITKYHLAEMARAVTDCTMDIHAGRAIQLGPRNYINTAQLANPIAITVEGANIITRNLIIFGQGAIRCHPYLLDEITAATQEKNVKKFDKLLYHHIGYSLHCFARSLVFGLTGGRLVKVSANKFIQYYLQQLTRMSSYLALCADLSLLILGGDLKRRENLSARLGDVLSYLFLASSVLTYFNEHKQPKSDRPIVEWCLQYCLYQSYQAFKGFLDNFPNRIIAKSLQLMLFPWGQPYRQSSDKLMQQLAEISMRSSSLRERLTHLVFISDKEDDAIGRVEKTFRAILQSAPIMLKINNAMKAGKLTSYDNIEQRIKAAAQMGIITAEEEKTLLETEQLRADAMQVDEFDFDAFKR